MNLTDKRDLKVPFFQKVQWNFLDLQISKKKFQKNILSLKFKFQALDSFWNIFFFWDLEIWKKNRTFWKKPPLGLFNKSEIWYIIARPNHSTQPSILIFNKENAQNFKLPNGLRIGRDCIAVAITALYVSKVQEFFSLNDKKKRLSHEASFELSDLKKCHFFSKTNSNQSF